MQLLDLVGALVSQSLEREPATVDFGDQPFRLLSVPELKADAGQDRIGMAPDLGQRQIAPDGGERDDAAVSAGNPYLSRDFHLSPLAVGDQIGRLHQLHE